MLGYTNQLDLKHRINRGELLGPNLYLAGPSFSGNTVNSPEEATARVKQQVSEGWDLLKVHPGLTLEEYTAMATTANELGIPFAGHIPEEVGLENAIKLGQQTIDHLDGYMAFANGLNAPVNEEKLTEAITLSKEHDIWVIPTQALWETLIGAADQEELKSFDEIRYMPKAVINSWNNSLTNISNSYLHSGSFARLHANNRDKLLKGLQEAGVRVLMGTDAPQVYSVPGFSIHRELKAMSKAGLNNYQILQSGTLNVGEYFKDKDAFGTIAPGQRADLLLVAGNPLEDLDHLKSMDGVMVRGTWLSRSDIDQRLAEIEAAYKE
jgi:imidazolonepropionase-like amidohydrolase